MKTSDYVQAITFSVNCLIKAALACIVTLCSLPSSAAEPVRPADALFELVPANSALILCVEDLRKHWTSPAVSRLVADVRALPFVHGWLESETVRNWEQSRSQIEMVLGTTVAQLRDDILGDAFVLALRLDLPPAGGFAQPQGLLLIKPRHPAVLTQLIDAFNRAQRDSGELLRVDDRLRGETAYHAREFQPESGRPSEYYADGLGGIFAISNSETLLLSIIDSTAAARSRSAVGPTIAHEKISDAPPITQSMPSALLALPRFQAVQNRLPKTALARLFVEPRSIEALLLPNFQAPRGADEARIVPLLEHQLAALSYAGAALTIENSMAALHAVETFDSSKLDPSIRKWADHRAAASRHRIPPSAIGLLSVSIDLVAVHDLIAGIIPERDQDKLHNLETILSGVLLGQDFVTRILPALGPSLVAYLDSPSDAQNVAPSQHQDWFFPLVMIVELGMNSVSKAANEAPDHPRQSIAAAVENALRAFIAVIALDEKRAEGRSRIHDQTVANVRITSLQPSIPFAFAVDRRHDQLIVATSAAAVGRYLEFASAADNPNEMDRLGGVRARAFAAFDTFFAIDFQTAARSLTRYRDRVVEHLSSHNQKPAGDVARDIDHLLQLSQLLDSAFVASRMEPHASAAHQIVGLVLLNNAAALKHND